MKQIKFGQEGPQLVSNLVVNEELANKFSVPEREVVLKTFKNVMIQALEKRAAICFTRLTENVGRILKVSNKSIAYVSVDNAVNVYNDPSYDVMLKAVELIKEDKYDELTAHMWDQLAKALYWVKPVNREIANSENHQVITFAVLISAVLDCNAEKVAELYTTK